MWSRRRFLAGAGAALVAGCGRPPEPRPPDRRPPRSEVAVLRARDYAGDLSALLRQGLRELGVPVMRRRVVLKPNFVEYDPRSVINTHPLLVAAAVDAFRALGASEVIVAEGPGHRRDNGYVFEASGLDVALRQRGVRFVDLNWDAVARRRLDHPFSTLDHLWLPRTVLESDLFVSMPKMKTHHWAGVTLSMKNLFGIVPGAIYGWPKNVLHWAGLDQSVVDVNAALPGERFAIVDGIVGMEGNGPIQGDPRPLGALVLGRDPVAVDATCARMMGLAPEAVPHLAWAGRFLGHLRTERITQAGEDPEKMGADFRVLPRFAHLKG
jgi:uncharacterized protein (DUF362 family)